MREEQKCANKPDANCVRGKAAVHLSKETKRPAIRSNKAPTEKAILRKVLNRFFFFCFIGFLLEIHKKLLLGSK